MDAKQKSVTLQRGTNRTVETTTIEGQLVQTTTTYDLLGRRRTLDDGHQNVWSWTYDSLGRVTQQVDPDSGTRTVVYDDVGRTERQTDALNQVVTLGYDTLGRVVTKTSPLGEAAVGQALFHYGEPRGGFSNRGRLTTVTSPSGSMLQMDYDALGRVIRQTRTIPQAGYTGTILKEFDAAGRLAGLQYPDGDTIGRVLGVGTPIEYDGAGRPLEQRNANYTTTTRTYVPKRGLLDTLTTKLTTMFPEPQIQGLDYGYDPDLPLVTSMRSPIAGESWDYGYDDGYRLETATHVTNPAQSQSFTYDSLGRMTSNSRVGDYVYPAVGQRLMKTSPQGTSLYPFGDDYEVTNGVTTKYISAEGLGVIAKRVTGGENPGTFWLHTDRLGSIQAVTNLEGSTVYRHTYRPYGETLGETSGHPESRGWIDQRNDPETGLTYLHARYFDPKLGTFLSPDPIGVGGGMNAYGYAFGDPVNGADRTGLKADCWRVTREDGTREVICFEYIDVEGPDTRGSVPGDQSECRGGPRGNCRDDDNDRQCRPGDPNCQERECKPGDPNCDKTCKPGDPNCGKTECKPGDPRCEDPLPSDIAVAQGTNLSSQLGAYANDHLTPTVCGGGLFGYGGKGGKLGPAHAELVGFAGYDTQEGFQTGVIGEIGDGERFSGGGEWTKNWRDGSIHKGLIGFGEVGKGRIRGKAGQWGVLAYSDGDGVSVGLWGGALFGGGAYVTLSLGACE